MVSSHIVDVAWGHECPFTVVRVLNHDFGAWQAKKGPPEHPCAGFQAHGLHLNHRIARHLVDSGDACIRAQIGPAWYESRSPCKSVGMVAGLTRPLRFLRDRSRRSRRFFSSGVKGRVGPAMADSLGEKWNHSTTNRNQSPTNCGDTFSSWLGGHSGLPCHPPCKGCPQAACSSRFNRPKGFGTCDAKLRRLSAGLSVDGVRQFLAHGITSLSAFYRYYPNTEDMVLNDVSEEAFAALALISAIGRNQATLQADERAVLLDFLAAIRTALHVPQNVAQDTEVLASWNCGNPRPKLCRNVHRSSTITLMPAAFPSVLCIYGGGQWAAR